jgi:uncharacterized membrane protein YsdA (DUF1294 family)
MHWRNRNFRYTVLLLGLPLLAAGLLWLVTDWNWLLLWLSVINSTTLLAFRYDKAVAADRKKRIPEKNLLRPIYLGGTLLALEDGTLWPGVGFGAIGPTTGEIVFNTSLTGYQEILTDPSYHGQIITMTMPHIGNVGTTPEDDESDRVWAAGLVVRSLSPMVSNWRAAKACPTTWPSGASSPSPT